MSDLEQGLATYGSDFSRWPEGAKHAREALLSEPEFRQAWQRERTFERTLAAERDAMDLEIERSGAALRLARLASKAGSQAVHLGIPWRRVAAGVLVAGLLGGALDLMLPQPASDPIELALVDPLAGLDMR